MLPILVHTIRVTLSLADGFLRKLGKICGVSCGSLLHGGGMGFTKGLRRTVPALLPLLLLSFLLCGRTASAQEAPDKIIVAVGPLGVQVTFDACYVSTEGNCPQTVPGYSIYRNPPGFGPTVWAYANLGNNGNSYEGIFMDQKQITVGQTYTYEVCSGLSANSSRSNCLQATPVTIHQQAPAPPSGPTVKLTSNSAVMPSGGATVNWTSTNATSLNLQPGVGSVTVPAGSISVSPAQTTTYTITATGPGGTATANIVICGPLLPPQKLSVLAYDDINLKWTNPSQPSCQPAPTDIMIFRQSPPSNWEFIADLAATSGILPNRYMDQGAFGGLPHSPYQYLICEGHSSGTNVNCALSRVTFRWGGDPVLTATRVNANTVQLKIAVDEAEDVSSISITRQGSDDPCRQGGTLGNGLQGCPTVGPNGTSVAQTTTVYNWTAANPGSQNPPGLQNSKSAPYIINLPDDATVKPAVEYYYQAQVGWAIGNVSGPIQTSDTATVPNFYATLSSQQKLGSVKSLKLNGGAPPPPSQSGTAPMVSPASRAIAPAPSVQTARPTGFAAAAPPSQPVTAARPMMASNTTAMPRMLEPARPMMSSGGAAAAPPIAQAATAARTAIAPMNAPNSRTLSSVKRAEVLPDAVNIKAAIKQVQQKPHDAQALYALGKAYCASRVRNTGVSYMYMALLLAEQARNAPLTAQIKMSLAAQGVSAK